MESIDVVLPDDLESSLDQYADAEGLDRQTAVERLLADGLGAWRLEQAVDLLSTGEVSFGEAAEAAGLSYWDFARHVVDRASSLDEVPIEDESDVR